ncbi:MAG TPA: CAP domain-containing protein [Clostridia bacterium]
MKRVFLIAFALTLALTFTLSVGTSFAAETKLIYGDVNGDGNVNSSDYAYMKRFLLGLISSLPNPDWNTTGDLDLNGKINSKDLAVLKRFILGTIDKLPLSTFSVSEEEQQLLDLINAERQKAGIAPLSFDAALMNTARLKAKDMSENDYFSHTSPTYGSPFDMMKNAGITYRYAGENLAGYQTTEAAVNGWMNSEGHKENILNPNFNYTGLGIAPSSKYGKIFVQQFIGK